MVKDVQLIRRGDGYRAQVQCVTCRITYETPVKLKEFTAWRKGTCIQDAMPKMTPEARELLATGTCPACYNRMFKRIVVVGWPKSGKSTYAHMLAAQYGMRPRATDELKDLPWSRQSEVVAEWLDEDGPWVIEGVVVVRALRKWKEAHPGMAPPLDEIVVMPKPDLAKLTPAQIIMGKGHDTILVEMTEWFCEYVIGLKEVEVRR